MTARIDGPGAIASGPSFFEPPMSRYLFRRRAKIVTAIAAVLIAVPLIGWASYRLALKAARDSRPPARVRYSTGAAGGTPQIVIDYRTDDAKLLFEARHDGGTNRYLRHGGGPGTGNWSYYLSGAFVRDGTLAPGAEPSGEIDLAPGQSAVLAKYRDPDGAPVTLRVWCLPQNLTEPSYTAPVRDAGGAMILEEDTALAKAWAASHPPDEG